MTYTISLGYAEYPLQGQNYSRLMRCADAALYEVKLDGKKMAVFSTGKELDLKSRKQLGFALKDVSKIFREHLLFIKQIKKMMKFFLRTMR